jgi:hypothetical protein
MSEHRVTELYYPLFSSCRALCRGKAWLWRSAGNILLLNSDTIVLDY